ncbi:Transferase [Corchorus olitorius]|uniref:Transferase n=1 Tax=Corchorus olitorius TaxID=93759 RepID=A0A1R3K6L9_9ROSI|nr:Transferase [Corchorus olitorius]
MAIGVCINHVIADASAATTFLNSWAAVASGSGANRIDPVSITYDSTTLFTPEDFSNSLHLVKEKGYINDQVPKTKLVTKRFVFEGSKITHLKKEIGNESSRFEAIMALIWAAMIDIVGKEDGKLPSVATMVLNLRNRTNPPLPQQCIGNVTHAEMVKSPMEKSKINMSSLSANIRECLRKVDGDYIKMLIADGECLDIMRHQGQKFGNNWVLHLSTFCGLVDYPCMKMILDGENPFGLQFLAGRIGTSFYWILMMVRE